MGRPSKPAELLKSEGKSHRTKQELAFRKQQEEATLTGKKLEEPRAIKDLKIAHATFLKTRRLLDAINKNDELYSAATCRYCTNTQKLADAEESIQVLKTELEELRESRSDYAGRQDYPGLLPDAHKAGGHDHEKRAACGRNPEGTDGF